MVKLLPDTIVLLPQIALVSLHDVSHHLRILLLLVLGDALIRKHALPVLGQTLKYVRSRMDHRGLQLAEL